MMRIRVVNKTRDSVLGSQVALADRWWPRLRGFLGRAAPRMGEGILLSPCRAVHMLGIPYALDVIFLDREGTVVAQYPMLRPARFTPFHRAAQYALELPAGTIAASGTRVADRVVWLPSTDAAATGAPLQTNGRRTQES